MSFNTLKRKAREVASRRGHSLGVFLLDDPDGEIPVATAKCQNCGRTVTVNNHPAPNEIDIGGDAVAVNCVDSREKT